jgi:hypothetical protein
MTPLTQIGLTHREAMIVHFQAASKARVALSMTPRWRYRRRRILEQTLAGHCAAADACRRELGVSTEAPGLADVFDAVMQEQQ